MGGDEGKPGSEVATDGSKNPTASRARGKRAGRHGEVVAHGRWQRSARGRWGVGRFRGEGIACHGPIDKEWINLSIF